MADDGTREDEDNRLRSEAMAQAVRPLGREVDRPAAGQTASGRTASGQTASGQTASGETRPPDPDEGAEGGEEDQG